MSSQNNEKKRLRQKDSQNKDSEENLKAIKKQKTNLQVEKQISNQSTNQSKNNDKKAQVQKQTEQKFKTQMKQNSKKQTPKQPLSQQEKNQKQQETEQIDTNANKKSYKKVKLSDEEYRVGDNVIVYIEGQADEDGNQPFSVGKIEQIFILNENKTKPYVKVTWYMNAKEINNEHDFIGDSELFLSNAQEVVEATSLDGHCGILTLEQYEKSEEVEGEDPVFYTRASWDVTKQKLIPPISQ